MRGGGCKERTANKQRTASGTLGDDDWLRKDSAMESRLEIVGLEQREEDRDIKHNNVHLSMWNK